MCLICHRSMADGSRSRHIVGIHKDLSIPELNEVFGDAFFTECPFPGCNTRHASDGLVSHWRAKHKGHPQLWPVHQEGVKLDYDGSKVSYKCD